MRMHAGLALSSWQHTSVSNNQQSASYRTL